MRSVLRQQVIHGVISITLAERRGEGDLRNPSQGVVGKARLVVRRVGDVHHVVFRVVAVDGQVRRGVRDRHQPVGIVVLIGGGFAVGVGHGNAPPAGSRKRIAWSRGPAR